MGMAPSSRSRIQDANGTLKQESSDNDLSKVRRKLEKGNDVHTGDTTESDITEGVGETVDQDENQGTDSIDKEVENGPDNNPHVANDEQESDNDANKLVNEIAKHMGSRRSRFQKQPEPSPEKGLGSLKVTQKSSNSSGQGTAPRGRGRPTRSGLGLGSASMSANKSTPSKRKRGVAESSLRRSSRAAAESATKQITEQSAKRPKAASAPSTPSTPIQKKVASGSGTRNKHTPIKTSIKQEFEVEYILDTRKRSGTTEYQVKWKGYHVKDNTWEPAANLTHCAEALKEFRAGWSKKQGK